MSRKTTRESKISLLQIFLENFIFIDMGYTSFTYTIDVTFDTPGGLFYKRYKRKCWQKVLKLLSSFDCMPINVIITTSINHVR